MTDWPMPVVGNAYTDKYGQTGVCIDVRENGFGHRWAQLAYADDRTKWHRTHLIEERNRDAV